MDWPTVLAISVVTGAVVFLLLLGALMLGIGAVLRRRLDQAVSRQAQTSRQLAEAIALLQRRAGESDSRIQTLVQANRRLTEEVESLSERLTEGPGGSRSGSPPRVLH